MVNIHHLDLLSGSRYDCCLDHEEGAELNVDLIPRIPLRNQSNSLRFVAPQNMKYEKVPQKVERALLWYLSPKTDDEQKGEDSKWSTLTAKERASAEEQQWRDHFD